MRRPLPPELVLLGDQLEVAVGRAIGHRRTRRQMVLNAAASLFVLLPLLPALVGAATPPAVAETAAPDRRPGYGATRGDDFPPRAVRGAPSLSGDVLAEPTTLRRALR